ncbi:hypothetical protein SPD48_07365 [Pseudogracilibacillus sp. SE30717A]|uniref:hypothetical protein n=1 Tax=Pseudogracilibacillus sp. SE30717A TaxID=3098293 RepID=UPI00300DFEC0
MDNGGVEDDIGGSAILTAEQIDLSTMDKYNGANIFIGGLYLDNGEVASNIGSCAILTAEQMIYRR